MYRNPPVLSSRLVKLHEDLQCSLNVGAAAVQLHRVPFIPTMLWLICCSRWFNELPPHLAAQPAIGRDQHQHQRNHRITECLGLEGTSVGPLGDPKQGHPEQAAQHRVQAGLEYLQRRRLHSLPGQPGPGLCHPQREEVLPHGGSTLSTNTYKSTSLKHQLQPKPQGTKASF